MRVCKLFCSDTHNQYADIVDLMVQGPAAELEKLKEPLADFGPAYYPLAEGSLRNKRGW